MKIVKISSPSSRDEILETLSHPDRVNENVKFEGKKGRPAIVFSQKGDNIKLKCVYMGGPSKDNGYIFGTYFKGKIIETNEGSQIRGYIVTEPLYVAVLIVLAALYVAYMIVKSFFSVIPLLVFAFGLYMMKDEFNKQGIILRYIHRALKHIDKKF